MRETGAVPVDSSHGVWNGSHGVWKCYGPPFELLQQPRDPKRAQFAE